MEGSPLAHESIEGGLPQIDRKLAMLAITDHSTETDSPRGYNGTPLGKSHGALEPSYTTTCWTEFPTHEFEPCRSPHFKSSTGTSDPPLASSEVALYPTFAAAPCAPFASSNGAAHAPFGAISGGRTYPPWSSSDGPCSPPLFSSSAEGGPFEAANKTPAVQLAITDHSDDWDRTPRGYNGSPLGKSHGALKPAYTTSRW